MTDFNVSLGFALFFFMLPIAIMIRLAIYFMKKNDQLWESVKEVAKEKGRDVLVKGIEWLMKKK